MSEFKRDEQQEQHFTSAGTSINSNRLPAVYGKVDFQKAAVQCFASVLDFGAGKHIDHIREYLLDTWGMPYYPCDPYNLPKEVNDEAQDCISFGMADVVICSNVLNVIDSDSAVQKLVDQITSYVDFWKDASFFVTVYEGDCSGVGKQTGVDQYQRNERVKITCDFSRVVQ